MIIPSKLKVVELRAELAARGLDTKGVKAALVERLQDALDEENGGTDISAKGEKSSADASLNETQAGDETENDTSIAQSESKDDEEDKKADESSASEMLFSLAEQDKDKTSTEESSAPVKSPVKDESPAAPAVQSPEKASVPVGESSTEKVDEPEEKLASPTKEASPVKEASLQKDASADPVDESVSEAQKDDATPVDDQPNEASENEPKKTGDDATPMEVDVKQEKDGDEPLENAEKQNGVTDEGKAEIKEEADVKQEESESKDNRKRKRSRSQSPSSDSESPIKFSGGVKRENEPDIDDNKLTLSWYDSDLSLNLDTETLYSASPLSFGGFGYIWSGVRASHGFTKGKLCYQTKITNYCDVAQLADEENPNVLRVGWSTFSTSLQLGEEPLSYGYGGTGKFAVNLKFSNYGKSFGLGDVITAYLEFTDDDAIISFSVNGEHQGTAVTVPQSELKGQALAPHILTKNVEFAVNFGQEEEPWGQIEDGYTLLSKVPIEETTPGPRRPESRNECEFLMMIGLPGCGKTVWANKYSEEHPEKKYNILGTNALIDKMKVNGLPRKANYHGRWDVLIEKCTKCLTRLMEVGAKRRRNFILDQTNVYPSAQRRKLRVFDGFIKKAVVIVPTDEEFKSRVEKQAKEEKKDVPESAVMEMKANFSLPDKKIFDEVIYVDNEEEAAQEIIEKYTKEAAAAGYTKKTGGVGGGGFGGGRGGAPPFKKFRGGGGGGGGGGFHHGGTPSRHDGGGGGGGGFRRGPPSSQGTPGGGFRRGGPNNRGAGGWPRDGQDRWRDNRNQGGYRHGGSDRPGWRGPPMGNGPGSRGPRDFDRRPGGGGGGGGYDRNARSGGGGPRTGGGGGGYNQNRDRNQHRGPPNDRKPRVDHKYGGATGTTGGSVTTGSGSTGQWGGSQYSQSASTVGSNQGWGQGQGNQGWGGQTQSWNYQQPQQQQQQWKASGYGQQQSSYGQGYNQPNYGGWQSYQGYQQPNYSGQQSTGSWSGQNSDGTYGNYTQNWPAWGYSTQSGGTGSQASNPSAHASQTK